MSELYLVAHKVRGEPAFDVALRMVCAECSPNPPKGLVGEGCTECDHLGYWWIIPTSGHRAYPWDSIALENVTHHWLRELHPMSPDLPDHYRPKAEPKRSIDTSALIKPKPFKMNRRI